jgi:hypothetical protein
MDIGTLITVVGLLLLFGACAGLLSGSRLFSVAPAIYTGPGWLIAKTSFRGRLFSLFSMRRMVTVDATRRTVTIVHRVLWLAARRRVVPFAKVETILYSLTDLNPLVEPDLQHSSIDAFAVSLGLTDGRQVHLFRFVGQGVFQTGWDSLCEQWIPDAVYDFFNRFHISGAQAADSREFVNHLQELLGVPVDRGTEAVSPSAGGPWWSMNKTCLAMAIACAGVAWGLAAAEFQSANDRAGEPTAPGARPLRVPTGGFSQGLFEQSIGNLLLVSVTEIPHAPRVVTHAFQAAIWIPCLFVILELGVLAAWYVLSRVERQLASTSRTVRRRRI